MGIAVQCALGVIFFPQEAVDQVPGWIVPGLASTEGDGVAQEKGTWILLTWSQEVVAFPVYPRGTVGVLGRIGEVFYLAHL